jgi:hypothetical protein
MRLVLVVLGAVVLVASVLLLATSQKQESRDATPMTSTAHEQGGAPKGRSASLPVARRHSASSQLLYGRGFSVMSSPVFSRHVEVASQEFGSQDWSRIIVHQNEQDPTTGESHESSTEFSVSYETVAIASRTANDIYITGIIMPTGDLVVERWVISHVDGAYYGERPTAPLVIGTPVVTPPMDIGIEGGQFIVPSQRPAPTVRRVALYIGPDLGSSGELVIDPDGRFVILLGTGAVPGLYRLMNELGGQLDLIVDGMATGIITGVDLAIWNHATGNVFLEYYDDDADQVLAGTDQDNDGVLDNVSVVTAAQMNVLREGFSHDYLRYDYP